MDILKELNKIGTEIDTATAEKNQALGAKKNITSAMESNFGATTLDKAEEKLSEMGKKLEKIGSQIEDKFTDLAEDYSW